MDDTLEPRRLCPNGHEVSAEHAFCGECGARLDASTDAFRSPISLRAPKWLAAIAAVSIAVLGVIWAVGHYTNEPVAAAEGATSLADSALSSPTSAAGECVQTVVTIVQTGLDDFVQGTTGGMDRMAMTYGLNSPTFQVASQQIFPKATLIMGNSGYQSAMSYTVEQAQGFCASAD